MSQPPSGSEPLRSNVVPYGEVHSTPEVMADISATPSSEMTNLITDHSGDPVTLDDNLGLRPRARAISGLRPCARAIFGSAPPIIQLALSIATSIFVVTVDFVHYFLTAARRLIVCARERFTAACALSAACVARAQTRVAVAFGSGVFCVFTILLTVILAVAVSGPTPVPVPAEPLPDMISINGACHFALTSSSASAQPPGRPPGAPGRQPGWFTTVLTGPSINNIIAGAETRRSSTFTSNHPPCPSPKRGCRRCGPSRLGGVASVESTGRRPAPLPSAALCLLHYCHRLQADADASCQTSPPGRRPWGGPGEGGAAPDPAAEAPAEAAIQEDEATAEATTQGAEATAEAAAHKAKEPAEASAQTEAEAPVTAAPAKAPAAAATRKLWWNLFRICNISAVAVATVEQGIASVKCDDSARTAGALLACTRDACAALDYDRTRPARICVQGCSMQAGVDFDQSWAGTSRSSTNRTLCAYAARYGCGIREFDWTAAYLQGDLIKKERLAVNNE
mmetsp:Transcript_15651/g.51647  ORF Transcript_15651/g.51647 Transcript_15651/m.51647 type:complete len:510 (+) Transcript_15651:540-2069(+)